MQSNSLLDLPLTFSQMAIHRLDLPQKELFVSGIGVRKSREALLLIWEDEAGRRGYGESSSRPDPFYSAEFIEGSIRLMQRFVLPHLKAETSLRELRKILGRIRGWPFTKAAVEMAALDLLEQVYPDRDLFEGFPLAAIAQVPVGISMGIQPDDTKFRRKVEDSLALGYQRLKFKISPATELAPFKAIQPLLEEAGVHLGFDANGSFSPDHLETLAWFVDAFQVPIEQPFHPGRFDHLLSAKAQIPQLKVCFDEEVKSLGDLVKLHQLGVMDELNLKPGRVGGPLNSLEIMAYAHEHQIPTWIGGMFETGIGRCQNLRFAARLPEAKAHDLSPSDRYFAEDLVQPGVNMEGGHVAMDSLQHCVVQPETIEKYTLEKYTFTLAQDLQPC